MNEVTLWAFFDELEKIATGVPYRLLAEANKDPQLLGRVHPRDRSRQRVPIEHKGETVGFFTPRQDGDAWRTGAIYLKPEHRGKGIAAATIRDFMEGKKGRVFIAEDNRASRKAFQSAGFEQGELDTRQKGHWFYKEKTAAERKAVIVKGNPKYVEGNPRADAFYAALGEVLKKRGYDVAFDPGAPYTSPPKADLWVGHSRGADRLRFAPEGTKTLDLGPVEHVKARRHAARAQEQRARGEEPDAPPLEHYRLTRKMRDALRKTSALAVLTGGMGGGKSTVADRLRDRFDVVEGMDTGSVKGGKFVELSGDEKARKEQELLARWLGKHRAGEKVLVEGVGARKYLDLVREADRVAWLEPGHAVRRERVEERAGKRGSDPAEDLKALIEYDAKLQASRAEVREAAGDRYRRVRNPKAAERWLTGG